MVQLAAQIEAAMLSAIEKGEAERYSRLKAKQDVELSRQGVRLQDLKVREAENGVKLADLQKERAQIQVNHYTELLDEGLSMKEQLSMISLGIAAVGYMAAASSGAGFDAVANAFANAAQAASTVSALLAQWASYERRAQEWEFQRDLGMQDVAIGAQGVVLAQDRVRITGQERRIAEIQADHAKDGLEFLTNKFTNAELYDWMSGVLEGVYSFFLQQATAVAKMAEIQLAFERQEAPAGYIQADYWTAPSEDASASLDGKAPDRRGLTGSARLMQDIYQLDQYAFESDKRKLQLSKTISLARMDPFAFQRFRETGVLHFNTPLALFDHDFPGHYLRLIKRVRTSVIALVPPNEGIHATLSTTGASRVVIGGTVFQTVPVRRPPESVALTSPRDATGLFDLQQQPEMLLPFEGMGVDTSWEFRMPKAANYFDYGTIADVLVTIDYTALNSFDYYQLVIRELDTRVSADRPFSFRNHFADAWYDLHNPERTATPMQVTFRTLREDFPSNLEGLNIQHVTLYFSGQEGAVFEIPIENISLDGFTPLDSSARTLNGIISTRRETWISLIGKPVAGEWILKIEDTSVTREYFKTEQVEDILLVITYRGSTPAWPA
jgi:hypothetical protein